ncbi:MAG: hypothetical protein MUC43_06105 [Pirellula sp.]|jgi:hypothetical protein|nr:hypothetical protein [Pirellula sp.]
MLTIAEKNGRGQALAEAFFFQADQELLQSLREKLNREEKIQAFERVIGIRDSKVVNCLVEAGFDLSTAMAFVWAPAMFVAWADGEADQLEKEIILNRLPSKGVSPDATSMIIQHEWFTNPPSPELWQLWVDFASSFLQNQSPEEREAVSNEIVNLCRDVADASGGFLGFLKMSQLEIETIERVAAALERIGDD